ncbi:MAG: ATP-binding protein [Lachnospiraceae bacterium]|nr:ATP-binding protein [Lachnospiraceae bacterium]
MENNRLVVDAVEDSLDAVQDFVEEKLSTYGCGEKTMFQLRLAVEEIFVNIISYAYHPEIGKAEVFCEVSEDPLSVTIQFLDSGKPFDPLARDEVDLSGTLFREREGGFGIHLVKQTMDDVDYEYKDGKNILTIKKNL